MSIVDKFSLLSDLNRKVKKEIKFFHIPVEHQVLIITHDDKAYSFIKFKNKKELICLKELCDKSIIKFSSSFTNHMALTSNGNLYSWGNNDFGQLGDGTTDNRETPKLLDNLLRHFIIDVCCSFYHTLVLTRKGEVLSFGRNDCGQLGNSSTCHQYTPVVIASLNNVLSISCGLKHSVALTKNGDVFLWGDNRFGQIGSNISKTQMFPLMLNIPTVDKIEKIECGRLFSLLLTNKGDLFVCGAVSNYYSFKEPFKLNNDNTFKDFAVIFYFHLIIALSENNKCFIFEIAKESKKMSLTEIDFTNLDEAFIKFSGQQITFRNINLLTNLRSLKLNESNYYHYFNEFSYIGSGRHSNVFKSKHNFDHKFYAIKKVCFKSEDKVTVSKELKFLSQLNSDFIVKYIDSWIEPNYYIDSYDSEKSYNISSDNLLNSPNFPRLLHIQMELCPLTLRDAINIIKKECFDIKFKTLSLIGYYICSELLYEILECVQYLHSHNPPIIHRDLKPENIFLTNFDNNRFVKLCDFGLATFHEFADQSHTTDTGTYAYVAPELFTRKYTTKADVYSLGIIISELFFININYDSFPKHKPLSEILEIVISSSNISAISRPNCDQILASQNKWRLSRDQCYANEEFVRIVSKDPKPQSIDEDFVEFFIHNKLKINSFGNTKPSSFSEELSSIFEKS